MTRLSVNVNKIATLRNARGGNIPNLLETLQENAPLVFVLHGYWGSVAKCNS